MAAYIVRLKRHAEANGYTVYVMDVRQPVAAYVDGWPVNEAARERMMDYWGGVHLTMPLDGLSLTAGGVQLAVEDYERHGA